MTKLKVFEKRIQKGNTNFYFKFIGKPNKENIDYNKLTNLIDKCFSEFRNYDDIVKNIAWIRTIFSDFEEKYLTIDVTNSKEDNQFIRCVNKEKFEYEAEKSIKDENKKIKIRRDFDEDYNISFSSTTEKEEKLSKNLLETIKENIEILYKLKDVKPITLDEEGKILYHIYRLFYNEAPDFSDKDINTKFQSMMSILTEFGICINDRLSFSMNYKNIPISLYLQQKIENYAPLGKIEEIKLYFNLSKYADSIIKEVSNGIRGSTPEEYDETEVLQKISSIIYTKVHKVSSKAKVEEIASLTHSAPLEVKNTLKLVKRINDRIYR